ncbi:unnamed protein product [Arabidopsis halleri]
MDSRCSVFFFALFSLTVIALAYDPDTLQDLCVADRSSGIKVNGFSCKPESNITASDFFFAGIGKPAVVNNTVGSAVTGANVEA